MVEFLTAMFIWVFLFLLGALLNRVFYGNWAGRPPRRRYRPSTFDADRQHCMCSLHQYEDD